MVANKNLWDHSTPSRSWRLVGGGHAGVVGKALWKPNNVKHSINPQKHYHCSRQMPTKFHYSSDLST